MKEELYYAVQIFIERCEVSKLHCYECTPNVYDDDIEKRYRVDYNKESSFHVSMLEDFHGRITYGFLDLHHTNGVYDPCNESRALKILIDECKKQGVEL